MVTGGGHKVPFGPASNSCEAGVVPPLQAIDCGRYAEGRVWGPSDNYFKKVLSVDATLTGTTFQVPNRLHTRMFFVLHGRTGSAKPFLPPEIA
jgi:hypothetical protein